jgi:hypothetical protein
VFGPKWQAQILGLSRPTTAVFRPPGWPFLRFFSSQNVSALVTNEEQSVDRGGACASYAFGCIVESRARAGLDWVYAQHKGRERRNGRILVASNTLVSNGFRCNRVFGHYGDWPENARLNLVAKIR